MLLALYERSTESDHVSPVDGFFAGETSGPLLPAVVFVCERPAEGLAGFLELSIRNYAEGCTGPVPHVESWYVDPDVRRLGIGKSLMGAAEGWARAAGYDEIASDATLANRASQSAHGAVGFDEVERAVHFRKKLRTGA
jgi:aminoglycoside 6'-N-acetyltransferase I